MARNFRLINDDLDPDSIVFLGDLLDGGREWGPGKPQKSRPSPMERLKRWNIIEPGHTSRKRDVSDAESQDRDAVDQSESKQSIPADDTAVSHSDDDVVTKQEHKTDTDGRDLSVFVPGENGRWRKWAQKQWDKEYHRFGRIFFAEDQLYPNSNRQLFADWREVSPNPTNIENGRQNVPSHQYAISGSKPRRLITSLPGNHDIGFGERVQRPVRDRFLGRFGEGNRVDVIGNHTFVSVDTPSLSAHSQFLPGGETTTESAELLRHIWEPTVGFLHELKQVVAKNNVDALREFYPDIPKPRRSTHGVVSLGDTEQHQPRAANDISSPQLPVVLLTHVPLFRDPDVDCGRKREHGNAIRVAAGYQYQNVLTKVLTNHLVTKVSAVGDLAHVFSGDDHDYCDVVHRYNLELPGGKGTALRHVREITAKSFNWAMGVRHPGFQLVSLWNPVDQVGETVGTPIPTIQTQLCLLPDQLSIFIDYAVLLCITFAALIVRAMWVVLRAQAPIEGDHAFTLSKLTLPRFELKTNGAANGYSTSERNDSQTKGRQRASSTSTSTNSNVNTHLSVQRTLNARTRSVSPNSSAYTLPTIQDHTGPLIDKAGYYPQVRWNDPNELSDDEESNVGTIDEDDSQAKWRRRSRKEAKFRRVLDELRVSLLIVGVPSMTFYVWLIKHG